MNWHQLTAPKGATVWLNLETVSRVMNSDDLAAREHMKASARRLKLSAKAIAADLLTEAGSMIWGGFGTQVVREPPEKILALIKGTPDGSADGQRSR